MKEQLYYLLERYAAGKADAKEQEELFDLLGKTDHDPELRAYVLQLWNDWKPGEALPVPDWEKMYAAIRPAPVRRLTTWRRITIAASVIFLLGFGVYFLFFNKSVSHLTTHDAGLASYDIAAPATNRATITLADGKKIFLDSTNNGQLATQNNVSIIKTEDGKINYQLTANSQQLTAQYNTLTNPRGSKVIDMTLADGSRVWLNAGSSITYPVAFMNNERKVSITGEAYFEVKHNDKMPFTVTGASLPSGGPGWAVHDIGTSFNINAYDDEDAIRVTLLEGSVKVSRLTTHESRLLTPGQQAILSLSKETNNGQLTTGNGVDIEQVIAWKNGLFQFTDADLQTVMRQLSRWYDLNVSYEGQISERKFEGKMQRNLNLSDVLDGLSKNKVRYTIEGKNITIRQ